jgi:hypothetical protein
MGERLRSCNGGMIGAVVEVDDVGRNGSDYIRHGSSQPCTLQYHKWDLEQRIGQMCLHNQARLFTSLSCVSMCSILSR